jgi:type III restriction/modification enzyme restriction subunit
VDEFHHAAAPTDRRLIDHFRPKFLLGLTATPERTDGGDLLALCEENLVYRCDLVEGVKQDLLCRFRYFGVPDEVDYRNIPWRNSRHPIPGPKRPREAREARRDPHPGSHTRVSAEVTHGHPQGLPREWTAVTGNRRSLQGTGALFRDVVVKGADSRSARGPAEIEFSGSCGCPSVFRASDTASEATKTGIRHGAAKVRGRRQRRPRRASPPRAGDPARAGA